MKSKETKKEKNAEKIDDVIVDADRSGDEASGVDTDSGGTEKPAQPEASLPENVTTEPQDDEHMHLGRIQNSPSLIDAYIKVSDDNGELLEDTSLVAEVKSFYDRYKNINVQQVENPRQLLTESMELANKFSLKINTRGSITAGILTKYLIRLGMIFNIQKMLVRKSGKKWEEWFNDNHSVMSLRSAQDYMKLAKVPNIIRYAFLGKERLIEISRVAKKLKSEDPVGEYLTSQGIEFKPEQIESEGSASLRSQVDTVIALITISKVEEKNEISLDVDADLIRKLIGMRVEVDTAMIGKMVIIKQSGGNPNDYLESRHINGGPEPEIITSTIKLRSIPKLVGSFKDTVDYIKNHTDLASDVDEEEIEALEDKLTELRQLMENV